jgi:hypothetical protein
LRSACPSVETSPAAVNAIQTFGDFLNFKKILVHLGRWEVKRHLPPLAHGPPLWDEVDTAPTADDYLVDPRYPAEAYF